VSSDTKWLGGVLTDAPRRDLLKTQFDESLDRLRSLVARSANADSPFAPPSHKAAALEDQARDELSTLLNLAQALGYEDAAARIEQVLAEADSTSV